jgi:hypothetical protein
MLICWGQGIINKIKNNEIFLQASGNNTSKKKRGLMMTLGEESVREMLVIIQLKICYHPAYSLKLNTDLIGNTNFARQYEQS